MREFQGPALVLAALTLATPLPAQVLSSPPAGIILPNYDLVRIGASEAIESGAVVARTTGPLANVYNPAGLAATKKTEINGSSTGYEYTRLSLEGIGDDATSGRFANLGGFLGVALAEPLVKSSNWRLGFSIFSPLGWEPGTLSGLQTATVGGSDLLLEYRTQVRLKAQIPAVAAGINLSPKVRFGASFQVPIISVRQQQNTASLAFDAVAADQISRVFAADGSTWNVRGAVGVQWDVSSALSLGLMVETPTARLWGSSFYSDEFTQSSGEGFSTLFFRDPSARLEYKLPWLVSGGAALRLGKFMVEGDVRWYSSIDEWDLYRSDSVGIALSAIGSNAPLVEPVDLEPVSLTYRSVVNFAVGASLPLSKRWKAHAGISSDQSPLPGTDEIFRKVDMFGFTAGVSFTTSGLSGALGLGLQTGTSPTTTVGEPPNQRDTKLSVKTFQLLYSLAYAF